MHKFDSKILKAYDIRGIYGQNLFDVDAYTVGRCFGTILRDRGKMRVCVGRDGRFSSPQLEKALIDGLVSCGVDVICIGVTTTPALYFAEYNLEADGAIMVTASHNPAEYNGFKMSLARKSFYGEDIQNFSRLASQGELANGRGTTVNVDILPQYIDFLRKDFFAFYGKNKPLKVVWDASNGAACVLLKDLIKELPGEHILINEELDPYFSCHDPDPTVKENLTQLIQVMQENQANLGIAFDGDADRVSIVDQEYHMLYGDELLQLFAQEVLKNHPHCKIIADVKASQGCFDYISQMGGDPHMSKTGHSHVKNKMKETGALLAGEMSGHMFFADRYFGFDDGVYAGLRALGIVSGEGFSLTQWCKSRALLVNTPEISIPCAEDQKDDVIKTVLSQVKNSSAKIVEIDGVRATYPYGWWLLRPSNTSEKLVARAEAQNEDDLNKLLIDLSNLIEKSGISSKSLHILVR